MMSIDGPSRTSRPRRSSLRSFGAFTAVDGIDFTVDYDLALGSDQLLFNASGTYLTDYRVAVTPTAPLLDQSR